MVRKAELIALIMFVLMLSGGAVPSFGAEEQMEKALDRGLTSNEPYAYMLEERARTSASEQKGELFLQAIKLSPDAPQLYFELAKSSLPDLFKSLNYAVLGVKSYGRNFWWKQSMLGTLFIGVFLSLAVCFFVSALIRLPMDLPLAAFDIADKKAGLLMFAGLVAMSALGPLFFASWALFIVGLYQRKIDKAAVYLSFILVIASPFILKQINFYVSAPSPELRAIVAVNEGRDNSYAAEILGGKKGFEAAFSYALALKREGRYGEALDAYNEALKDRADGRVYNNIGNVFVAMGRAGDSKESYKKAVEMKPSVAAYYNLSQVYRDTLDFKTGDEYYDNAQKLGRDKVSWYTAIAGANPNRYVIDETLTQEDFINYINKNLKSPVNPFSVGPYAASFFAFLTLVFYVVAEKKFSDRAYRCTKCYTVVSGKRKEQWGRMCPDCYKSLVKMEDLDSRDRITKLLAAQERESKRRQVQRFVAFAPPGVSQIYSGRLLAGVVYMFLFVWPIVTIFLNRWFAAGISGYAHWWLSPLMLAIAVFVYLASLVFESRRIQWL